MNKSSHTSPSKSITQSVQSVPIKSKKDRHGNGDTRAKPITEINVHFDYLRIRKESMTFSEFELLLNYISIENTVEFDTPWRPGKGAKYFPHRVIGTRNVQGGFDVDEDGLYSIMIDMPGEYFDGKTLINQWNLMVGLHHTYNVIPTRLDIAIDDHSYSLIPIEQMVKACDDGHNFGFKKIGLHSSGTCGQVQRETRYFGARNSGKFVRVYDHDGECLRFEAEFKKNYVKAVFEKIVTTERGENYENWEQELQKIMASIALGAIDFRNGGNRKDPKRAGFRDSVRLDFWQKFIDVVAGAAFKIKLVKPATTIVKNMEWMKRQCSQSLAMLAMGLGKHHFSLYMKKMLDHGFERMNNGKKLWAKEIQKNKQMYC